jgi:hypothetical protein
MYLSMKEVCLRYRRSRSTIHRWILDCGFPQPVRPGAKPVDFVTRLGKRVHKSGNYRLLFLLVAIEAWEKSRT